MAIGIIAVLSGLGLKAYLPALPKAKILNAIGYPFDAARQDSLYYHAIHGTWPENNVQAADFGWADDYPAGKNGYIEKLVIENGAIHQYFNDELPGKIITLRPAVPAEDDLGPIIWICGDRPAGQWQVFGEDRTNISEQYIHRHLK